jgi:DNA adenine methylase
LSQHHLFLAGLRFCGTNWLSFLLDLIKMAEVTTFLRYPGGKQRMLSFLSRHLPTTDKIEGRLIEPFVGGGAIYFFTQPRRALLSDLNSELIDLYRALQENPTRVWTIYRTYPNTKKAYKEIREANVHHLTSLQRAARLLYLNRTCFKGMWRHNRKGKFNIGYGGQSRRWCLARKHLVFVSRTLQGTNLLCSDFEPIIKLATCKDYLFLDPPYRPGDREQVHDHYVGKRFSFEDHCRLAASLKSAHRKNVKWLLTVSDHGDILRLYRGFRIIPIPRGTGREIGSLVKNSGEVLITNNSVPSL